MRLDVPVTPDAETAREWAREELSNPEYADQGTSWFESFLDWVGRLFDSVGSIGGSLGPLQTIVIVALALGIVALVLWLVLGPLRRARRTSVTGGMLDDDHRSSQEMRQAALSAHDAADWDLAIMEWFRASVRRMEERGRILDSPGATAQEAATLISAAAPVLASDAVRTAKNFDIARYGAGGLGESEAAHARGTFEALDRLRPLSMASTQVEP